jgi:competence protein ComEC
MAPIPPRTAPAALRFAPHAVLVAFCAGLATALVAGGPVAAVAAGAGCAAGGAAVAIHRGRARAAMACLAVAAGLAGLAWGTARLAATAAPRLDLPARVDGVVTVDAPAAPTPFGDLRARARVERLSLEGGGEVPRGTRILLDLPPDRAPHLGARLRVRGRLRPAASSASPGWWRRWLERQAVAGRLRPEAATAVGRRGGVAGARDRWREWAGMHAGAGLSGDRRALVRGMALGGGSGLSEDAARAFRDAGLWHLLAVSGQNVAVVALATLALLTALGVPRRAAVAASGVVMLAYCLACDGGASVARAGIVGGLGLLAELRSAPRERWYLVLAGLAVLLAQGPRALGDPGLQLSFAAVAGLLALGPPLAAWARGWLPGRIADLAAMAAAAGLATAPVLVWQFGRLSLAGLVLNVVAVPLAAPVVVLALAGLGAGALLPAAGVALAWLAGLGAWALMVAARAAAAVPGAAVDLPPGAAPLLLVPPLAVVVVARALRPGAAPVRARLRRLAPLGALGAALALGGWALGRPGPAPPWPATPEVTALDIGQGDAILLRSPEGGAALVDTGPPATEGAAPVIRALRREGVRRLDVLALTHDSLDHVGGAPEVLARLPVGVMTLPPEPQEGWVPAVRRALAAARARGVPLRVARAGTLVRIGRWALRVLSPAGRRPRGADPNPYSMVALASADGLDALLTADAESPALAALPLPRVDVLKVSHHGSEDPGIGPVLARLRPRVALISAGEGNPFGHPRAQLLAAMAAAGVTVRRTDLSGDVSVRLRGGSLVLEEGS